MIKASAIISLFRQALAEEWGYIWGQSGDVWTQAEQDAATREKTVLYGQQHVGKRVADCSGLFVWAFRTLGGSIYHGSNTIFNKYTTVTGALGGMTTLRPGTAVFMVNEGRRTHIGLYVGNGVVIEAQGTKTGVVESSINMWEEWGELVGVEYDTNPETFETDFATLRKGDRGELVEVLQKKLLAAGCTVKVDGIFGANTLAFVLAFQRANGLTPDGIVGKKTWAKLNGPVETDDPDTDPAPGVNRETIYREALEAIRGIVEGALNG